MSHRTTRRRIHGQGGFTASEFVLVAVFVVGLIWVAVVSVNGIRDDTQVSNCQTWLRNLKLATEQYNAENSAYPVNKSVLVDAELVSSDEVQGWQVAFDADDTAPSYLPRGDCR